MSSSVAELDLVSDSAFDPADNERCMHQSRMQHPRYALMSNCSGASVPLTCCSYASTTGMVYF